MKKENNYSEKLKDPRWQKKRLQILNRDKWKCKLCGDTETNLQVFHKEYINGREPWEYENNKLITLCKDCHIDICLLITDQFNIDINKLYVLKVKKQNSKISFLSFPGYLFVIEKFSDNSLKAGMAFETETIKKIMRVIGKSLIKSK